MAVRVGGVQDKVLGGVDVRIGWVDDWSPRLDYPNELLIGAAPPGVEVVRLWGGRFRRGLDLYVCTGIRSFSHPTWDYISNHPHILYIQDYMLMAKEWQQLRVAQMVSGAEMTIFRSPMHRDEFIDRYALTDEGAIRRIRYKEVAVCPSPIDVGMFPDPADEDYPTVRRKRSAALWVANRFVPRKGLRAAEAWARKNKAKVDFFAFGRPPVFLTESRYCKIRGPVSYRNMMPTIYPKYKRFLHLPEWKDPFSCATAEAVLSGLEIVGNGRIGLFSYPWGRDPFLVRQRLAEAPAEFWKLITKGR